DRVWRIAKSSSLSSIFHPLSSLEFVAASVRKRLFSQTQLPDDLLVPRAVFAREVLEQAVALPDHLAQPAARRMILLVRLEVLGQLGDALRQQRDLHFRRAGVFVVGAMFRNRLVLPFDTA